MRYTGPVVAFLLFFAIQPAIALPPQKTDSDRKVIQRVVPAFPDLARNMNLSGTVRMMVTIAPNGSVKSVEPLGGNPVFLKAAQDALSKWKFAPGLEETREIIELRFHK